MMIRCVCLLSCLLAVSLGQNPRENVNSAEDEPVILCGRELCPMICAHGYTTDERGCATCECLQDPCSEPGVCGSGQSCSAEHQCTQHPCMHEHTVAVCRDEGLPCPEPMCAMPADGQPCQFGFANNERGCMTCDCREAPVDPCEGQSCPLGHQCLPIPDELPEGVLEDLPPYSDRQHLCLPVDHVNPFLNRFGDMPPMPVEPEVEPEPPREEPEPPMVPGWDHEQLRPLFFEHNIDGDMSPHLDALTRLLQERLGRMLGHTSANLVIIHEVAVHGDISEHRVRVVLAVRTDQPLIRELLERFMTMLERYEITIQYGQYQLTQVPEPNLIIDPVPPRPGSSEEEHHRHRGSSSESWEDDSDESSCGRIWRAHRGLAIVAIVGAVLLFVVVAALICSTCMKRRMAQRSMFSHSKLSQYHENLAYGNDLLTSPTDPHPDVMIKEKSGHSDAYMVSVPESKY